MRDKRLLIAVLGMCILVLVMLSQLKIAQTVLADSPNRPVVTWSQKRVTAGITSGATFSTTVTFTSTVDLKNVALRLTPSLKSAVTISPTQLSSITAGTPYTVEITVTIPAQARRTSFSGTLSIRAGHRTFANPLNLKFNRLKSPNVTIQDFKFTPAIITIRAGETVTWRNKGPSAHTTTSDTGIWNSNALSPGATFSQLFVSPGQFTYHCMIHPFMHGTVVVSP